ncbi:hypothetical protein ACHQM5_001338 [Ranunculus cassubicifolius]
MQTPTSRKVAVIGAGAAGIIAARELHQEGHQITVFERNSTAGGLWVYSPTTESDPLGIDPSRTIIHSSVYESLRANLPRELSGFSDFPFVAKPGKNRDPRRFPRHEEVALYLNEFVNVFGLTEFIRFETEVILAKFIDDGKFLVRSRSRNEDLEEEEFFNAVVVCNGHYTNPRIADIPGIDVWPGKQIHSHNYRVPDPYKNKVVVLVGYQASGYDISREIAEVAKEVHIASKKNTNSIPTLITGHDNMWLHSKINGAYKDGRLVFEDGTSVLVDIILHCTGYKYDFPFLDTGGVVTVDENRVDPLYKHVFPPSLAPWLSFIGIPFLNIPFSFFEAQSKWVARILSGRASLPSEEEMISSVNAHYSKLESAGVPKGYTHVMGLSQFEYTDWLAAQGNFPPIEDWRKEMFLSIFTNRDSFSENYRDEWDDEKLISRAYEDFRKYLPSPTMQNGY